jgi:hypothetical protein
MHKAEIVLGLVVIYALAVGVMLHFLAVTFSYRTDPVYLKWKYEFYLASKSSAGEKPQRIDDV